MRFFARASTLSCAVLWLACGSESPPSAPEAAIRAAQGSTVDAVADGGGEYEIVIPGLDISGERFSMSTVRYADGSATGRFHHALELEGQPVEFHGLVTCASFDPVNHRAWIGGIVTENNSVHPGFRTEIHEPGKDIWFRVVDYGEGEGAPPDRTTFVGFEGAAGIITSQEYCDAQLWPDEDARTWAVRGNVEVRP